MELLSKFLLIASLLMLSWHWAASMPPRSPSRVVAPAVNHHTTITPPFPVETMVQSIFDPVPKCREGEIATGQRCHRIA